MTEAHAKRPSVQTPDSVYEPTTANATPPTGTLSPQMRRRSGHGPHQHRSHRRHSSKQSLKSVDQDSYVPAHSPPLSPSNSGVASPMDDAGSPATPTAAEKPGTGAACPSDAVTSTAKAPPLPSDATPPIELHQSVPPPLAPTATAWTSVIQASTKIHHSDNSGKAPRSEAENPTWTAGTAKTSAEVRQKTGVRFGGTTLLEFIPLTMTTITDIVSKSPVLCGGVGALIAFGFILATFLLWPVLSSSKATAVCSSQDCRDAHRFMTMLLDASVDPCHDFYRHVCRIWHGRNFDGTTLTEVAARDLVGLLPSLSQVLGDIRRGDGENSNPASGSEVDARILHFYDECKAFMTSADPNYAQRLREAFRSDVDVLTLPDTAATLRRVVQLALQRGISTLFNAVVVRHHAAVSLYVSRGETLAKKLGEVGETDRLEKYFKDVLQVLRPLADRIRQLDAQVTVHELLEFDASTGSTKGAETTLPSLEDTNSSCLAAVAKFDDTARWVVFVNSLLPENGQIDEKCPVICQDNGVIAAAAERVGDNFEIGLLYVLFHVVMEIGKFYYGSKYSFEKPHEIKRVCVTASQHVMGATWAKVFTALIRDLLSAPSRTDAIFVRVRNLSSRRFPFFGMDDAERNHSRVSLNDVYLQDLRIQMPTARTLNAIGWNSSNPTDFVALYTTLKTLEATRRLLEPPALHEAVLGEAFLAPDATYSRMLNSVVLPPAAQRPPVMYSTRVPLEYDSGTVGVLLAKQVFKAGFPSPRSAKPWYKRNVDKFVRCIQASAHPQLRGAFGNVSHHRAIELFALSHAVRIAHAVMQERYFMDKDKEGFEATWKEAQRTFFRRFCLLMCSTRNAGQESRLRCLVPLLDMIEFNNAFNCRIIPIKRSEQCIVL